MRDGQLVPTVLEALLNELHRLPQGVQDSTEAATAIALARELDRGRLMSTAPVAKELMALLDRMRALAPPVDKPKDPVDDLTARRAARRPAAG